MDEAAKATPLEALVALTLGKRAILVGDHRQLRPTITYEDSVKTALLKKYKDELEQAMEEEGGDEPLDRPSLFEEMAAKLDQETQEAYITQLLENRRSHPEQVEKTSKHFYESHGDEALEAVQDPAEYRLNLKLTTDHTVIFLDIGGRARHDTNEGSPYNPKSAALIGDLLKRLQARTGINGRDVGVITPYRAQKRRLDKVVNKLPFPKKGNLPKRNIRVQVVDQFQGLENDVVILDLVRAGQNVSLGFMANDNRMNVALSRQRYLLFIVGDYQNLCKARQPKQNSTTAALKEYLNALEDTQIFTDLNDLFHESH